MARENQVNKRRRDRYRERLFFALKINFLLKMKKIKYLFIASIIAISGCAGSPFKWDQARLIKEGMSEKELSEIMGSPYQVRVDATGQQLWQWVQVDLYGVSGGTRTLNVPIKDGKVLQAPVIPESFK